MFVVVGLLTVVFLVLYGLATWQAFKAADDFGGPTEAGVDADVVVGATLAGLAMFAILFLGTVLAVFLTLGAVRGDAERGLLQPLLVRPAAAPHAAARPLARRDRGLRAVRRSSCALAAFVLTGALGGWWPDRLRRPLLGARARRSRSSPRCRSPARSSLAATANGIAVFMLFGAGLTAGLLGQIAEAIGSDSLDDVARRRDLGAAVRGALPGRRSAELTADTVGFTRLAIDLGPFGGAAGRRRRPVALVARLPRAPSARPRVRGVRARATCDARRTARSGSAPGMMITDSSKRVIPFRERDAKRIGAGCFYLDSIVWLERRPDRAGRTASASTSAAS